MKHIPDLFLGQAKEIETTFLGYHTSKREGVFLYVSGEVTARNIIGSCIMQGKITVWQCHDRDFTASAVTRIRTWVVSATTRSTNHYTITAIQTADNWHR